MFVSIIKIKSKENKPLGAIRFKPDGTFEFVGEYDKEFAEFVKQSVKKGITYFRDIYDEKTMTSAIVETPVKKNDSLFPLVLKDWLEREGYEVTELRPETEEKIKNLLRDFSDDSPNKIGILKRLSEMSYLEMTTILEGLQKLKRKT